MTRTKAAKERRRLDALRHGILRRAAPPRIHRLVPTTYKPDRLCSSGLSFEGRSLAFTHAINGDSEKPPLRTLYINRTELFFFSAHGSIFAPHEEEHSFVIDGRVYRCVYDFYRTKMFDELTHGQLPYDPQREDTTWRNQLIHNGVSKDEFDDWFVKRGLLYIQYAILQRMIDHKEVQDALVATGQRCIVYSDPNDQFFGTAEDRVQTVRKWDTQKGANVIVFVPTEFPLSAATLPFLPRFWNGHNVLGTIYTCLRDKLTGGTVPLTSLYPQLPEWVVNPLRGTFNPPPLQLRGKPARLPWLHRAASPRAPSSVGDLAEDLRDVRVRSESRSTFRSASSALSDLPVGTSVRSANTTPPRYEQEEGEQPMDLADGNVTPTAVEQPPSFPPSNYTSILAYTKALTAHVASAAASGTSSCPPSTNDRLSSAMGRMGLQTPDELQRAELALLDEPSDVPMVEGHLLGTLLDEMETPEHVPDAIVPQPDVVVDWPPTPRPLSTIAESPAHLPTAVFEPIAWDYRPPSPIDTKWGVREGAIATTPARSHATNDEMPLDEEAATTEAAVRDANRRLEELRCQPRARARRSPPPPPPRYLGDAAPRAAKLRPSQRQQQKAFKDNASGTSLRLSFPRLAAALRPSMSERRTAEDVQYCEDLLARSSSRMSRASELSFGSLLQHPISPFRDPEQVIAECRRGAYGNDRQDERRIR
ncbi:hypothetical protein M3Y99_00451400 [Aphelenchoides fujianensis]|nr:hypothetical protein M3Y99_00451400 [Aphelenchoides fujianensis]